MHGMRTCLHHSMGFFFFFFLDLVIGCGESLLLLVGFSSCILLPGKSHGQRGLVGCSPWGCQESDMTERVHFHFSLSCIGEGNGNPLQCSCLENPRGGGAWWAAVSEVAQSRTRLKRLSSGSSERGLLFVVVSGFFIGVASLCRTGSMPCWLQQLQLTGSRAWTQQVWHMGLVALQHVGSSPPQTESMSSALADGFLTTGPPGRSPTPTSFVVA